MQQWRTTNFLCLVFSFRILHAFLKILSSLTVPQIFIGINILFFTLKDTNLLAPSPQKKFVEISFSRLWYTFFCRKVRVSSLESVKANYRHQYHLKKMVTSSPTWKTCVSSLWRAFFLAGRLKFCMSSLKLYNDKLLSASVSVQ